MENLVQLTLIECVSNVRYPMKVTQEIYDRTKTDTVFATEILTRRINEGITVFDGPLHSYETSNTEADTSTAGTSFNTTSSARPSFKSQTGQKSSGSKITATDDGRSDVHNWTRNEVLLLINAYKNHQLELLKENNSKNEVWSKIVKDMTASLARYDLPPIDLKKCKTKMDTLKRHYKSIKDNNKKSGNQKISWAYYDQMEELFGEQPCVNPLLTAGSYDDNEMDPDMINPPTKRKKSFTDVCAELLEAKKESRALRKRHHQEKIAAANKLTDALKDLVACFKQKNQKNLGKKSVQKKRKKINSLFHEVN